MNTPPPSTVPSPENLAQLDAARKAAKKIRSTLHFAYFDGWSAAAIAAVSIPFCLTSVSGLLLCLGMAYIAWSELSSAAALKRLDALAPRRLAVNQLIFSGILILYFGWSLIVSLTTPSDDAGLIASAGDAIGIGGGNMDHLARVLNISIYGGLILLSILFQGGAARYYYSRIKIVKDYLATTPQWIIDYQRGGGTL
jgi:hypothetical protein